ncbi:N/A [soil metagenome]
MVSVVDRSPLQLMALHIDTLFCCDPDGRLRGVNEAGEPSAPRFYMGRTHAGNVWRFRYDLPAATVEKLERLCQAEPLTSDLASLPQNYAALRALLQEHAPIKNEYRGPAYWIPEDSEPAVPVVLISETNAELLRAGFSWALPLPPDKNLGPFAAAIEQDSAVSLCFCSRRPAQATEAGLETLAAFRGKGYATATVAKWAAEVRRMNCLPMYSTSWDNLASQAVARKLKMVCYGEDWSIQ